jgi:hypothetical protein
MPEQRRAFPCAGNRDGLGALALNAAQCSRVTSVVVTLGGLVDRRCIFVVAAAATRRDKSLTLSMITRLNARLADYPQRQGVENQLLFVAAILPLE